MKDLLYMLYYIEFYKFIIVFAKKIQFFDKWKPLKKFLLCQSVSEATKITNIHLLVDFAT